MTKEYKPKKKGGGKGLAGLSALIGACVAAVLISDIRKDEGRRYHPYRDIGGILTICDGDTKNVRLGMKADDKECDNRTAQRLLDHAKVVTRCVPELLEKGREFQLKAAISMDYNTGAFCKGWWRKRQSPGELMAAGKWREGCKEMLRYNLVKGKPIRGLTLRRQREVKVCLTGL